MNQLLLSITLLYAKFIFSNAKCLTTTVSVSSEITIQTDSTKIYDTPTKHRIILTTNFPGSTNDQCASCFQILVTGNFDLKTTTQFIQAVNCERCWCGFTNSYSCECDCSYEYEQTPHIILTWNRWQADLGCKSDFIKKYF
jgi:hypothetical protein